jgi:hypothetical protein
MSRIDELNPEDDETEQGVIAKREVIGKSLLTC